MTLQTDEKWLCMKCLQGVTPEVKVTTIDMPISGDLYSYDKTDYICPRCGRSFGTIFIGRLPDQV